MTTSSDDRESGLEHEVEAWGGGSLLDEHETFGWQCVCGASDDNLPTHEESETAALTHLIQTGHALEARCGKCGETFNPIDATDLIHIQRLDGKECGGTGSVTAYFKR